MKKDLLHLKSTGSFYNTKTGVFYAAKTNNRVGVLGDIWVPDFTMGVEYKNITDELFNMLSERDYQKIVNSDYYIYNS
jgi:hypothetical protein